MEALNIPATRATPEISFDPRTEKFALTGRSIPADASDFYGPLDRWIEQYVPDYTSKSITIDIKLDHLNTGSVRSLLSILSKVIRMRKEEVKVIIHWYHDEEDEDMVDKGEEMSLILEHPFKFVPFRDEE